MNQIAGTGASNNQTFCYPPGAGALNPLLGGEARGQGENCVDSAS